VPSGIGLPPGHAKHVAQTNQVDLWRTSLRYPQYCSRGLNEYSSTVLACTVPAHTSRCSGLALAIDRSCALCGASKYSSLILGLSSLSLLPLLSSE
jgi:hypothetical protein